MYTKAFAKTMHSASCACAIFLQVVTNPIFHPSYTVTDGSETMTIIQSPSILARKLGMLKITK